MVVFVKQPEFLINVSPFTYKRKSHSRMALLIYLDERYNTLENAALDCHSYNSFLKMHVAILMDQLIFRHALRLTH